MRAPLRGGVGQMKKKRAGKKKDLSQNTLRLSQRGWEDLLLFKTFIDEAMHAEGYPRPASLAVAASIAMNHAVESVDGTAVVRNIRMAEGEIVSSFSTCILGALKEILPDVQFLLEVDLESRRMILSANNDKRSFEMPAVGSSTKISMRQ